ncbi:MAG: hypothetical protein ACJAXW_004475 [Candidatus Azotimanducaceae bacterium]
MNDDADHIAMLTDLIRENLQGWQAQTDPKHLEDRLERAKAIGATV